MKEVSESATRLPQGAIEVIDPGQTARDVIGEVSRPDQSVSVSSIASSDSIHQVTNPAQSATHFCQRVVDSLTGVSDLLTESD